MRQVLVLNAMGPNQPALLPDLTRYILECGCNIVESRMSVLGAEFACFLLISGAWDAIARLESGSKKMERKLQVTLTLQRTTERPQIKEMTPYAVDVVSLDQEGTLFNLTSFFTEREITVCELSSRTYVASYTGATMMAFQMTILVPASQPIAHLREEFTDFCDKLNLDAIMEPVKS